MQALRVCGTYFGVGQPLWQVNQRLVSTTVAASCAPAAGEPLYRILLDLEGRGRGRRVNKVAWEDNTFWHIVDIKEHPRAVSVEEEGAVTSDEQLADGGEEPAPSDGKSAVKAKSPPKLPSIFAIKFVDGAPTTGRVVKMKNVFKREWQLLPQQ